MERDRLKGAVVFQNAGLLLSERGKYLELQKPPHRIRMDSSTHPDGRPLEIIETE